MAREPEGAAPRASGARAARAAGAPPPASAGAGATRALDKSYHWRGVAYPAGDAVAVPADFPTQAEVDAWRHAPAPFDLDSVFPPAPAAGGGTVSAPFVSAAGQPIAADTTAAETWPEKAAREAAARAAGETPDSTSLTSAAQRDQAARDAAAEVR